MAGGATSIALGAHIYAISTRSRDELVRAIGMNGFPKRQISPVYKQLGERVRASCRLIEGEWATGGSTPPT